MAFAKKEKVAITAPNLQMAKFRIIGTSPMVQNKFGTRALEAMAAKQAAGSTAKKSSQREAKNFDLCVKEATHVSDKGWEGIPASAFRNGLVSACRLIGFPMTLAKLSIFVVADGYERDRFGVQPLVTETVVQWAKRNPKSALHSKFNWNDTAAAHQYRLIQARNLITEVEVIYPDGKPRQIYVSPIKRRGRGKGGYMTLVDVMSNEDRKQQFLEQALNEYQRLGEKYLSLQELAGVRAAVARVAGTLKRQQKRAVRAAA